MATSFGVPVVVIAGAGTGKTRAITHRIAFGSVTGAYNPRAVLAVTFTTRAAGELRTRLQGLGVSGVQARTFHSAALRQAQYFWPRAYGSPLPAVSDDRLGMVAEAAHGLRRKSDPAMLRDLLTEVSWAKVSNVVAADYPALAAAGGREVAGLGPDQVGMVLARYEQVKATRRVIDFDDILLCAAALLGEHPAIAEEVRGTYRHLVVDEYQDVSPVQEALLGRWLGSSGDLCVVGDPAQTIHSFAGATPQFLTGFSRRFPTALAIRLVRNYRSTPQVVGLANSVSARVPIDAGVSLRSQQPPGTEPELRAWASEADEAAGVVRWIGALVADGVPLREIAVLYRVHAQSPLLESALAEAGIPFSVRGGEGFFDRAEVRRAVEALQQRAGRDPEASASLAAREVLATLGWTESPPSGQGRARERWESWSALLALADDLAAENPGASLAHVVVHVNARAERLHPPQGAAVTLSTLHAAKGLEWDAVALIGVQEGTLPIALATRPEQIAEEGRLLYVGLTRARRHLLVSWARSRRSGGASRRPSRFLDGLQGRGRAVDRVPRGASRVRQPRDTALTAPCRVCALPLRSGAERKLKRHRNCEPGYDEGTFRRLTDWRRDEAGRRSLPPFCIFTDATLMAIAEQRPEDEAGLRAVPGVGRAKCEQYAAAVLTLLDGGTADAGGSVSEAGQVVPQDLREAGADVKL